MAAALAGRTSGPPGPAPKKERRPVLRLAPTSLVLLCLASPVLAQDQGSFALDAMTTPGRHFGAGYYVTDGFSLRPSLGLGYAQDYGFTYNLGVDTRYEFLTANRVSPYVAAGISYLRSPYVVQYDASGGGFGTDSGIARYGAGVG